MFVAMGASAVIPVLHGISLFGITQLERQMGLSWLVLQGVLYVSGAAIYAVSIRFDMASSRDTDQKQRRDFQNV